MLRLSFIVPVYNVEKYIRPCIESIYNQGIEECDFEVILINDGTQDNSFIVIDDIIKQHDNIVRLDQCNQGLSAARNTGLNYARGHYVVFVDSDDLLVSGSLSSLLELAEQNSADMIVADFVKLSDEEILCYKHNIQLPLQYTSKTGIKQYTDDMDMKNYVWRTIYRLDFLKTNNLKFISGICYEDMPFTTECYLKARICLRVSCLLYIYRKGHNSITSTMSPQKALDLNVVIEKIWGFGQDPMIHNTLRLRLKDNIFETFSFLLWCVSHNKDVFDSRKVIVSDLRRRVPDLWFSNGIKQNLVSLLFRLMPNIYLKLRSLR